MKERIISICVLLLASLTIWLICAEIPKKNYAMPASDFTEAIRNGTRKEEPPTTAATGSAPAVANEVIRLHILADSDSQQDQSVKLALRDALLPYLQAATLDAKNKADAMALLAAQCPALAKIANDFLAEQNAGCTATISMEQVYFPIRIYGSQTYLSTDAVIFPPGFYDSVQVVIGSGEGHNWWCLAYPSLCFIDSTYDYIPKDSNIYKWKIGAPGKEHLRKLFYGEEGKPAPTDIYFGFKIWELVKALFPSDAK